MQKDEIAALKALADATAKLARRIDDADRASALCAGTLTALCQAVIQTHPRPSDLREAWNARVSEFWAATGTTGVAGHPQALALKELIDSTFEQRD